MQKEARKYANGVKYNLALDLDIILRKEELCQVSVIVPFAIVKRMYETNDYRDIAAKYLFYISGARALDLITTTPECSVLYVPSKRTGLLPKFILRIVITVDDKPIFNQVYQHTAPSPEQMTMTKFKSLDVFKAFLQKIDCLKPSMISNECMNDIQHISIAASERYNYLMFMQKWSLQPIFHTRILERMAKCDQCNLISFNTLMCSSCKTTRYCSKECQKKDWREHKKECV